MVEPQVIPEVGAELERSASDLKRSWEDGDVPRLKALESENAAVRLEFERRAVLFAVCSGDDERLGTMLFRLLRECRGKTGGVLPVE